MHERLLMYDDLAPWWPLMSDPQDYATEAGLFRDALLAHSRRRIVNVLELGCGGGNNALHLKAHFEMTLTDLSERMLAVSRALNPQCEHIRGDMRSMRLGRLFDGVFVHDAIAYMAAEADLGSAMTTAFVHLAPGGAALFVPDFTLETFTPSTECGGRDQAERAMRYLAWTHPPEGDAPGYDTDFVYILRDADGMRVLHETHHFGLFSRQDWLRLLREVGFEAYAVPYDHSTFHEGAREMFCGVRP